MNWQLRTVLIDQDITKTPETRKKTMIGRIDEGYQSLGGEGDGHQRRPPPVGMGQVQNNQGQN